MFFIAALFSLAASPVADVVGAAHDAGVFDGEVLIARDGGVVSEQALGWLDREQKRPQVVGSVWRWASVTKQVTAVLVMQEVEKGRLSLDANLASVLPAFKGPTRKTITLRMLLQHTSGLPNPDESAVVHDGGFPSFYESDSRDAAFGFCAGPTHGVTKGFSYNNCDYLVLAAVLERVTKQSWASLVHERIVKPFGLTSVKVAPASEVIGYDETGGREPGFSLASFGAAGALGGTVRDLFRFDEALRTGRLLGAKSLETLWAGVPALGYEALGQWSYSVPLKGCAGQVQLIERRGDIGGVQVANVIAPKQGVEVLLFSNTAKTQWGEVWRGQGLLHDVLAAAVCQ